MKRLFVWRRLPLVLVALVALAAGGAVAVAASSSSTCSAPCRIVISEVRTNGSGGVTTDQQTISVPAKTVTNTVTSPPVTTTVTVTTPPPTTTTTTSTTTTNPPPPPPSPASFTEGFNSGQPGYGDLWGGPDYYTTAHAPGWVSDCDTSYIHSVSVPDKPTNVGHAQAADYCQRWYTTQTFDGPVTKVEADVKPIGWGAYGANASWAGFKFYLRRQGPKDATPTYTIEFYIRDGQVHIQKGDCNGYGWYPLLEKTVDPTDGSYGASGTWHHFEGDAITNPDGSVTLKLIRDGQVVAQTTDTGGQAGCSAPLQGGVEGFRSDWAEYYIDDFTVTSGS